MASPNQVGGQTKGNKSCTTGFRARRAIRIDWSTGLEARYTSDGELLRESPHAFIAVLEDDPRRIVAIREAARSQLADYDVVIFAAAPEMIRWLQSHADEVRAISLDCDLDATAVVEDRCGSGEDVASFLARNPPNCPVLIHSSNAMRAPAMHLELALAGVQNVVLRPFHDSEEWAADVRAALASIP